MKKKWQLTINVLLILVLLPLDIVYGTVLENQQELKSNVFTTNEEGSIEFEEETTTEFPNEEEEIVSEENTETDAPVEDIEEVTETSLGEEDAETEMNEEEEAEEKEEDEMERSKSKKADVQDDAGFWLVDSPETFTRLLKDKEKLHFRLTDDIDLAGGRFELRHGVIIDGDNHIMTYNKGGSTTKGLTIDETNAVVEIRNLQVGNTDGSGSDSYYGFITGRGAAVNMTFIFDNVDYYSNNGNMIYNPKGSAILRGNNNIVQVGTGLYSREWASTNYVEIQSGTTNVEHGTGGGSGVIRANSNDAGNPYANSSQLIVRQNASLYIETNVNLMSGYLEPTFTVESNASLTIDKVKKATGTATDLFFSSLLSQPIDFHFHENSNVEFVLPRPINVGNVGGAMRVDPGVNLKIDVADGSIFSASERSNFSLNMYKPERVEFTSTREGTLGLNTTYASTGTNFHFEGVIDTYDSPVSERPTNTIARSAADLKVRDYLYTNGPTMENPLTARELDSLKESQKLIMTSEVRAPIEAVTSVDNVSATNADFYGSSLNRGSRATQVEWLLFSSASDLNNREQAVRVINKVELDENNTAGFSTYHTQLTDLNPNTNYWVQMVVTNELGSSEFSEGVPFSTLPGLQTINISAVTDNSATISGELAGNNEVYGGNYEQVTIEYSQDSAFSEGTIITKQAELSGDKYQNFTADLTELAEDTTYFVRLKVLGVTGEVVMLSEAALTQFTTEVEIINVEIPIEMTFATTNADLGTVRAGKLYSNDYKLVNHGSSATKVSLVGLEKQNEAAANITLRQDLLGETGTDEMALQLLLNNNEANPFYLTESLMSEPVTVGIIEPQGSAEHTVSLTGKYFNPFSQVVFPKYELTFKIEKNK